MCGVVSGIKMKISDYKNPDPNCGYPFYNSNAGYCWSYAFYVDGDEKFKNILEHCKTCEHYKPNAGKDYRELLGILLGAKEFVEKIKNICIIAFPS